MDADKYLVLLPRNNIVCQYLEEASRARVAPEPSEADIIYRLDMKRLRKNLDPALTVDEPRSASLKRSASEAIEPTGLERTTDESGGPGSSQRLVVESDLPALPTSHEALRWISEKDRDDLIASFIPKAPRVWTYDQVEYSVPGQNLHEHRRAAQRNQPSPLKFRCPVATSTPMDVWRLVLQLCDPDFLLKARMVCRGFSSMLECAKIWKEARLRIYGPHCPDPPASLTEWQYAELLNGVGCQAKNCADKEAKRVYWIMQRRWCEKCWEKRTLTTIAVRIISRYYGRVSSCAPYFSYDEAKKHHFIGARHNAPNWARFTFNRVRNAHEDLGFERRAIRNAMSEIDGLIGKSQDEKDEWYRLREIETKRLQSELKAVEYFFETRKQVIEREIEGERRALQIAKRTFFEEKAMLMNPPMRPDVLYLTSAFQRAVASHSLPTESTWRALSVEVKEERREAQILANIDAITTEASDEALDILQDRIRKQDQRMDELRRGPQKSSDLSLVLRVAELVMNYYLGVTKTTSNDVADEDLIPLTLKEFYAFWHHIGEGSELDGKPMMGYDLILDDAYMIVMHVIGPVIEAWDNFDRQQTAETLKCPVCENDEKERWSFDELMDHIIHDHSTPVGVFSSWRPPPVEDCYTFYRIRWPANLPVLAEHQEATGHWDLNTWTEHHRLPAPVVVMEEPRPDAFAFRHTSPYLGPHYGEFVENILFAADATKNLHGLSNGLKTLMVLKYAAMKYPTAGADLPTWANFCDMQTELVRHGYEELFENFKCKPCVVRRRTANAELATQPNGMVTRSLSLGEMIEHSEYTHSRQVWTEGLFLLPSGEDLSRALAKDREAAVVFNSLFPLNASYGMPLFSNNALIIVDGVVLET